MTKLKIAIVIENFFPHIGGVEKHFLDLAKELQKHGMEVRVVTSDSGGISGFHQFEGIDVYSYHWPTFADHAVPWLKDLWEHAQWADMIHTSTYTAGPMAYYAGKKYGKPVLITVHEVLGEKWSWIESNYILQLGYRLFERFVVSYHYDGFACVSEATKRDLLKTNVAVEKVWTVFCAIDDMRSIKEDRQAFCSFVGADSETVVFLYYGRPGQPKGIFVYLDAIKRVAPKLAGKKVKFAFILSKEPHRERSRFLREVQNAGLESLVTVCDPQPREKLLQYVKSSDFVVVPSITEGFGLVAAESCQLGKKVIHSDGGALPESTSGLTLSFTNRNSEDLAEELEYAVNGGKFKQTPLKLFSAEKMAERYLEVYKRIMKTG